MDGINEDLVQFIFGLAWLASSVNFAYTSLKIEEDIVEKILIFICSLPFIMIGLYFVRRPFSSFFCSLLEILSSFFCSLQRRLGQDEEIRENTCLLGRREQHATIVRLERELQEAQKEIASRKLKSQELETKLTIERKEFKKFQDKSVEYQQQREVKIKELEAKIDELNKKSDQGVIITIDSSSSTNPF